MALIQMRQTSTGDQVVEGMYQHWNTLHSITQSELKEWSGASQTLTSAPGYNKWNVLILLFSINQCHINLG